MEKLIPLLILAFTLNADKAVVEKTEPSKLVPGRLKLTLNKPCYLRLHNTEENVFDIKRLKGANDTQSYIEKLTAARKCDDGKKLGKILCDGKYGPGEEIFGYGWDRQQLRMDFDLGKPRPVGAIAFHMRDNILWPTESAHSIFILFSNSPDFKEYAVRGPYWGAKHIIRRDDYNNKRDKGLWRKHYYTVMLDNLDVEARYVRAITDSMNFWCDETELLMARKGFDSMGKPVGSPGPHFCPYYPRLKAEVLDVTTPLPLCNKTKLWNGGESWLMKPVIEAPEGVEFLKGAGYDFTAKKIKVDGKPYIKYTFTPLKSYGVYWKTKLPAGRIGPMWITDMKNNDPYRQKVELKSQRLPACPLSKKLIFKESARRLSQYMHWPGFFESWWKLGMTSIGLCEPRKIEMKEAKDLKDFRLKAMDSGYNIQWACDTFLDKTLEIMEKDPSIRHAMMPEGHEIKYPCPYEILEKMDNVLLKYFKEPGALGINIYQHDWEGDYGKMGCFCEVCCQRFKEFCAEKYPEFKDANAIELYQKKKELGNKKWKEFETAWWDYNTEIGLKIWNRVRKGAIDSARKHGKTIVPQFGFYAVPFCRYPYVGPYKTALKKGITNIPEPCAYNPNPYFYEWGFGMKDWTNKTIAYPGIAGPLFYGENMAYYITVELFGAGISGAIWFPAGRIFGRSFVELADAVRQGALVDEILEHGEIFPELLERRRWSRSSSRIPPEMLGTLPPFSKDGIYASDGTRVIGCQHSKRPDEKLVIPTKYYIDKPHHFTVRVPVKKESIVISLYDRREVAKLSPSGNMDFPCELTPPKHEAKMFLVVPVDDARRYSKPLLGLQKPEGNKLQKPQIEWFAPAVSADIFYLEFSKNPGMTDALKLELSPQDAKGKKDGMYVFKLDKKILDKFRGSPFYWRVGAKNKYTPQIAFSETVKILSLQEKDND